MSATSSNERMAMTALAPSSRRMATPLTSASRPAAPAPASSASSQYQCGVARKCGSPTNVLLSAGSIVRRPARYAPVPTKAMWPNERIPELPEKSCSATTSTTLMKKWLSLLSSPPHVQPQIATSRRPPAIGSVPSADSNAQ